MYIIAVTIQIKPVKPYAKAHIAVNKIIIANRTFPFGNEFTERLFIIRAASIVMKSAQI